jgi:hypothetical protein
MLEEHTPSVSQIGPLLCVWRSFESKKLCDFQKMDEREFCVLIKHYFMKGKSPQETKEKLDKHHGESAPSIRRVYKWFKNFRSGHMSTSDAECSGCPLEATTLEIVYKIHDMVMDDRGVKVREIASAVGISSEWVHNILHQHLNMRKLSTRWVLQLLTDDQKRNRVRCSKDNLQLFQLNPQDFRRRFVTVDKTWIHHYTPETKEQPKQWVPSESLHQGRQRQFFQPGRLWRQSFGIRKEQSLSTIWKRVKLLQVHSIHRYWTV